MTSVLEADSVRHSEEQPGTLPSTDGAGDCDEQGFTWSLYPPAVEPALQVGDTVHTLYDQLRAEVVGDLATEGPYAGRMEVLFEDKKRYHVRPSRMMKITRGFPQVFLTAGTSDFRKLARALPTRADRCVDVGCSYGKCTALLAAKAGSVLGVDNSRQVIAKARAMHPDIHFECIDAILDRQTLVEKAAGPQLVFLDIGGDRELDTLVLLIPLLQRLLKPEVIVVKGYRLARAASKDVQEDGRICNFKSWWGAVCDKANERMTQAGKKLGSVQQGTGKPSRRVMHPLQYPRMFLKPQGGLAGLAAADPSGRYQQSPTSCTSNGSTFDSSHDGVASDRENHGGNSGTAAPAGNSSIDGGDWKQICRYHNYMYCKRGDRCPHDHTACHCCGRAGHKAVECEVYAPPPPPGGTSAVPQETEV
eukprot:TRINITY_DN12361_c0_g1_i1.p1 TRINITY_DN12361_c0_g1~~TRINITY_DN12361_c0_g1_i1.p1  ORF type:complete len:419 (+),score=116.70 TRINITY_DN12361_c0_g1_i1:76-1332(+)